MAQRISRFGVGQTAKVLGVLYALMGVILIPFFLVANMFGSGRNSPGMLFVAVLPILYGVFGFIFTAIGCAIYNLVAGWVGGIEMDLAERA